MFDITQ